jgi:hypothetical protein
MSAPGDGGVEDGGGTVGDGELVVAGGESSPLFESAERSLDDVAFTVVDFVERGWSAASGSATFAMPCLVARFGDHGLNAAVAQVPADRSGGVGLVTADPLGSGSWAPAGCAHAAGPSAAGTSGSPQPGPV